MYILFNKSNTVNYTGVTSDIVGRIWQHKTHYFKGSFSDRYNVTKLVYLEDYQYINDALDREHQIKQWGKRKKLPLVESMNPEFRDLALDWPEFQEQ